MGYLEENWYGFGDMNEGLSMEQECSTIKSQKTFLCENLWIFFPLSLPSFCWLHAACLNKNSVLDSLLWFCCLYSKNISHTATKRRNEQNIVSVYSNVRYLEYSNYFPSLSPIENMEKISRRWAHSVEDVMQRPRQMLEKMWIITSSNDHNNLFKFAPTTDNLAALTLGIIYWLLILV